MHLTPSRILKYYSSLMRIGKRKLEGLEIPRSLECHLLCLVRELRHHFFIRRSIPTVLANIDTVRSPLPPITSTPIIVTLSVIDLRVRCSNRPDTTSLASSDHMRATYKYLAQYRVLQKPYSSRTVLYLGQC
jgi:hypothetical protein